MYILIVDLKKIYLYSNMVSYCLSNSACLLKIYPFKYLIVFLNVFFFLISYY